MKKLLSVLATLIVMFAASTPASAQFRWGVRAGVNINSLSFGKDAIKDVVDSENRAGFVGGLTTEFTVPIIGLGFDASLMYVHRVNNITDAKPNASQTAPNASQVVPPSSKGDYLELPINLKYKIGLPVVGKIITPYIATGPSFAVLCSKKAIDAAYKQKAFDISWNVGVGVQLVNHLQIGASYGIGMTKAFEKMGVNNEPGNVGKPKVWTVTAAYLF